ncbi:MAG: YolD-like family protein [Thermincolia bacterium]
MYDNKLWEGHRLLYPQQRDNWLQDKKTKVPLPNLTEEQMERLEQRVRYALKFEVPLLIRYVDEENQLAEVIAFRLQTKPGLLICLHESGRSQPITFTRITDIQLLSG